MKNFYYIFIEIASLFIIVLLCNFLCKMFGREKHLYQLNASLGISYCFMTNNIGY